MEEWTSREIKRLRLEVKDPAGNLSPGEISAYNTVRALKTQLNYSQWENKHLGKKLKRSESWIKTLETILELTQQEMSQLEEDNIEVQTEQECKISELTSMVKGLKRELNHQASQSQRRFGGGDGGLQHEH